MTSQKRCSGTCAMAIQVTTDPSLACVIFCPGGPLMYFDGGQWLLAGTLLGMGYDCWSDKVKLFEGSDNGVWNKVGPQVTFIHMIMRKYGEKTCRKH